LLAFSAFTCVAARSLWSTKPATHAWRKSDDYLLKTAYPVGNGQLGAIPHGPPGLEKAVLNIDSLWSGGPFESEDYNGGNPNEPKYGALPDIRAEIFSNGTGSVAPLLGSSDAYGAYQTLGNLTISIEGVQDYKNYKRVLDLETGVHTSTYKVNGTEFSTVVFCTYPDERSITIVHGANTNFDQTKGNAENDYSFKGQDPAEYVERVTKNAAAKSYKRLLQSHTEDYGRLASAFTLDLPDPNGSANVETAELIAGYTAESTGDPFLEALLFDYSRHLLITSSRPGSLPANLQGRWTEELWPAWSADYHANINLQMNYWAADQTGLSETQDGLWDYMELNWAPRGSETAKLLRHPASAAWMMQHVWDNFDYTRDVAWFKRQGYPLIKGVARFWLSQLQEDGFFEDGTLVVNPCNSPEHGPTTFGCAHYQQEIHRTLDTVLSGAPFAEEDDEDFLEQVRDALGKLDKGFHVTEWGGVKEWKIPDWYGYDEKSDHRHLSHLTGWHPGYSLSAYHSGYGTNGTIQDAVRETLIARGDGNAGDANAGWAKVWRTACWARLNDTEQAHFHLRYAIQENFVGNGFSMYDGQNEPFQIDANFGLGGAVLSMLVVDLPLAHDAPADAVRTVVLGPAIPASWKGGSVKGLRVRGAGTVDFSWDDEGVVDKASVEGLKSKVRFVNVKGEVVVKVK
ncbi:alpha-L-fucosidase, partial [Emericellopsis atlantica]